ncbi:hypothetical protein P154DRAFT_523259 [Amniculicola lignicola CBS 123094]|uniref:C3H1-type domain-containing protein n=1 Tax=Amniculicola lignicola CBS 123094 TaxID=1392246 RepID=A0A6A5WCS2_9PLEO|nr:hypothetical protein P154DRAFT_523259 [Amniculicola lignicola CBS 123094]
MCKRYLSKSGCADDMCPLSHKPSANRMPHCVHFVNGRCTNDHCKYAHVRIPNSALICEPFARLGYCEKGEGCSERHTYFECPDHVNKGHCDVKGCKLPHTIHAGRLRQQARRSGSPGAESESSTNHSNDEVNTPKIDGRDPDGSAVGSPDASRFTQQADYVPI